MRHDAQEMWLTVQVVGLQVSEMVFQIFYIDNLCTTMHIEKIRLINLRFFFLPSINECHIIFAIHNLI